MVCAPCQKKAEARRQAMLKQVAQHNKEAAKAFDKNTSASTTTRVLPRYEGPVTTNTTVKPTTIWNEWYQAFMMNKSK